MTRLHISSFLINSVFELTLMMLVFDLNQRLRSVVLFLSELSLINYILSIEVKFNYLEIVIAWCITKLSVFVIYFRYHMIE